jgi:hypothetical protein
MTSIATHRGQPIISPDKDRFLSEENPFEAMMSRFDYAAQRLSLDPGLYKVLRIPEKQIIVAVRCTGTTARWRSTPATGCSTIRRAAPPRAASGST